MDADWDLLLKTIESDTDSIVSDPANYADYDTSITPTEGAITGLVISTYPSTVGTSASLTDGAGFSTEDATYEFSFVTTNPIPSEGVMILKVPDGITIDSDLVDDFTIVCSEGCSSDSATMSYDDSDGDQDVYISGAFASYLEGGNTITFAITGWTNPAEEGPFDFEVDIMFL